MHTIKWKYLLYGECFQYFVVDVVVVVLVVVVCLYSIAAKHTVVHITAIMFMNKKNKGGANT